METPLPKGNRLRPLFRSHLSTYLAGTLMGRLVVKIEQVQSSSHTT